MINADIIIVGAGASGLMAARELSKNGKRVIILEAKDRIGGRIWPQSEQEFGYPAQGGAEFVHGEAAVTKALLKDANLTYVDMAEDGEMWTVKNDELVKSGGDPIENPEFAAHQKLLKEKLSELESDVPIADFLQENFADEKYSGLRQWITRMVQGFDAADPNLISTFSLRDEWLGEEEWEQGRVKEGYKAVIDFLEAECEKFGTSILLNKEVSSIFTNQDEIEVRLADRETFTAEKIIITVALPVIKQIEFKPDLSEKLEAASRIGFGQVIKLLLRFKTSWWNEAQGKDLSKMSFLFSNQPVGTWWTQYPETHPVLTGWIAGPKASQFKDTSSDELLDLALTSLANIFKVDKTKLETELIASKIANWPADRLTQGAYSYSAVESEGAYEELRKPVDNKIFFAGEAVYLEKETATVEGALASGKDVARKILKITL